MLSFNKAYFEINKLTIVSTGDKWFQRLPKLFDI